MNQSNPLSAARRARGWRDAATQFVLGTLLVVWQATPALAENTNSMIKPPVALPGGLSLHPVITSVTRTQDLVTVEWFGIQGPYQLLHSAAPATNLWSNLAGPTFGTRLTVPLKGDLGFFRVLGGRPVSTDELGGTVNYVGAGVCVDCHSGKHERWKETGHAQAFETLKTINQHTNTACLVCHTVGYGTPLGFKSESATPHLAGVQCENCHGPGGSHVANVRDASVRPKVTVAAEVCGGCHTDFHHPTFDEWKKSQHAIPNADVSAGILAQGEPRMLSCGPCHSGAVRLALLGRLENPAQPLPSREDAAYFPVTCAVCHDPHQRLAQWPGSPNPQLRNPLYSTDNFSYSTATNTSFVAQYNPNIQICGQCHNMRGARWQDTSRPPHHSPQYNILVGQGAYDQGNSTIAAHGSDIDLQCAGCHTHLQSVPAPTAQNPNYTGHTFEVRFDACVVCHIRAGNAEAAKTKTQTEIKAQIESVRALLDSWATNKAPAELRAKYRTLTWEYTTPGQLSNPTSDANLKGPTATEQARIPDAVKQARMNLYLVQHDGSFGVHNGTYVRYLLNVAKTNITAELAKP